jgi:murein DD-endopeptidase MepM/ murein hydrolase activator NlpD
MRPRPLTVRRMPPPRARLLLVLAPLALLLLALLLLPRPAGASARERWRWPVEGEVVGAFRYVPQHPFAAGARRGIDIAASPSAAVRSACRGRVTFAGPLPGGRGLGVTVRCGDLVATHLGLGRVSVRRGATVGAGRRLGALGAAGRLRLGARRSAARFGYVDPLGLLAADPPPAGDGPPPGPLGRAPGRPAVTPVTPTRAPRRRVAAPRPRPFTAPSAAPVPAPGRAGIPAAAWAGLVLLAAGVPLGGLVHRGRRRRRAAGAVVAAEGGR